MVTDENSSYRLRLVYFVTFSTKETEKRIKTSRLVREIWSNGSMLNRLDSF